MPNLPSRECTGCSACAMICPVRAIGMAEDSEGFLRPRIEDSNCIHCGKCERCCPIQQERPQTASLDRGVYAATVKDPDAHQRSQSGGVFYALASAVLREHGAVYGAAQNEAFETLHIRAVSEEELRRLQGVKYVQSALGDSFARVGEDLTAGKQVLFSGTPCQVAGLLSYLTHKRISQDRLLTADLVCYGVPSPGVFRQWVKTLEKAHRARLTEMYYRRTDAMWGQGKERYRLSNGIVLEGAYYTRLFFNAWIIRPGCESCRFCNTNRPGDITLGDFWGIKDVMPEFYDDRGVSLVICNTEKGTRALRAVEDRLVLRESTLEDATKAQPRLQGIAVTVRAESRAKFWKTLRRRGMGYIAMDQGFIPPSLLYRAERKLKSVKHRLIGKK